MPVGRNSRAIMEPSSPSSVAKFVARELRASTRFCATEPPPRWTIIGTSPSSTYSNRMPARLSPSRHLRVGRSKSGLGLVRPRPDQERAIHHPIYRQEDFHRRHRGSRYTISIRDQQSLDDRWLQSQKPCALYQPFMSAKCRSLFRKARDQDPGDQEHQARRRDHLSLRPQLLRRIHQGSRVQMQGLCQEEGQASTGTTQTAIESGAPEQAVFADAVSQGTASRRRFHAGAAAADCDLIVVLPYRRLRGIAGALGSDSLSS